MEGDNSAGGYHGGHGGNSPLGHGGDGAGPVAGSVPPTGSGSATAGYQGGGGGGGCGHPGMPGGDGLLIVYWW